MLKGSVGGRLVTLRWRVSKAVIGAMPSGRMS